MKPNLFLVGFQKCGSSSLFDWLIQHSQIKGTSPKETYALVDDNYEHFNEVKNISSTNFNWSTYINMGIPSKYIIEGSVCNFYQERALSYISEQQQAKIIFIVRNPIKRFISCYNYLGLGGAYLPVNTSLKEYYKLAKDESVKNELLRYGLSHGKYSIHINRWKEKISNDRILITSLERFSSDIDGERERILKFLELDYEPALKNEVRLVNRTKRVRNEYLHHVIRNIFKGKGLGKSKLAIFYNRLNKTTKNNNNIIDGELLNQLNQYYANEFQFIDGIYKE